ncbi:MAG: ABC transporter substrate-binding protein, partial [Polyangia bacterium]|nr:ABC transporter substrate-binding protein [Polyangia bacterium]
RGREVAATLRKRLDRVERLTRDRPRRSVLVVFGRSGEGGALREVYAAGRGGLYDEVIALAGGRNAYGKRVPAFPKLGPEGILQLDPDVIVELASEGMAGGHKEEELLGSWQALPGLGAVKAGRVRVLPGEYSEVPGPRLFRLVEELARVVHPEADWGRP